MASAVAVLLMGVTMIFVAPALLRPPAAARGGDRDERSPVRGGQVRHTSDATEGRTVPPCAGPLMAVDSCSADRVGAAGAAAAGPCRRTRLPPVPARVAAILALYPVWFMISTAFKANDQYLENTVRVPLAARRGELRRRAAGRRVLPLAREQRDPRLRLGRSRDDLRGPGRVRGRPHALSRPGRVPVDQRRAPDRPAGRHADPALHAVHAVLDGLDLLGRDHPLRGSDPPVLRLSPVELLPGDPAAELFESAAMDGASHFTILGGSCSRSRRRRSSRWSSSTRSGSGTSS